MLRRAVILFLILFIASTNTVFAARKIFISSDKNTISNSEELVVQASASGFMENEKFYIKGAFFKDGSTNYFGYTKSNNGWIKNSAFSENQMEVVFGSWDKKLIVKNDPDDSGFGGSGDYMLKVGFYYINSKGNLSSVNWSENSIPIKINFTPTQAPEKTSSSIVSVDEDYEENFSNIEENNENANNFNTASSKKLVESDKISTSPRSASSYAKIKPITEIEDETESEVLGEETKNNSFAVTISVFGIFLIFVAGFYFLRREIRERKIF